MGLGMVFDPRDSNNGGCIQKTLEAIGVTLDSIPEVRLFALGKAYLISRSRICFSEGLVFSKSVLEIVQIFLTVP